jgi:hypothetical protein
MRSTLLTNFQVRNTELGTTHSVIQQISRKHGWNILSVEHEFMVLRSTQVTCMLTKV